MRRWKRAYGSTRIELIFSFKSTCLSQSISESIFWGSNFHWGHLHYKPVCQSFQFSLSSTNYHDLKKGVKIKWFHKHLALMKIFGETKTKGNKPLLKIRPTVFNTFGLLPVFLQQTTLDFGLLAEKLLDIAEKLFYTKSRIPRRCF